MKSGWSALVMAWLGTLALAVVVLLATVDDFGQRAIAFLDFLGLWLKILGIIAIIAIGAFTVIALAVTIMRHRHRMQRPVDGAFALQRFRRRRWDASAPVWLAVVKWLVGEPVLYNPNLATSPVVVNDWEHGVIEVEPEGGWDRQLLVRLAVEKTNAVRAMYPGDDVRRDRYGTMSQMPRLQAGGLRALTDERKPPQLPTTIDGEATPVRHIGFAEALRGNTANEFAVGQDVKTGEIVRWNLERHPHARFHGTTQGSGKTNLAKHILLGMLLQGAHIVVLDRRNFKNFGEFQGYAEFIPTNAPERFVEALERLCEVYQERDRLLGQQSAADISQLHQRLPRYGVLLCEFGSLCEVARAEGLLNEALKPLSLIMREAAAAGVHLLFEDQTTDKGLWPRSVQANAGAVFTGYLPTNQGQAGGYYHAHTLKQYEFHYDGHVLRGWNMQTEAPAVLRSRPRQLRGDLMLSVEGGRRSAFGHTDTPPSTGETERPNDRTPNAVDDTTELQRAVWAWRDAHPDGTQAELRHHFAMRGIEIARGYVHECWHRWPGPNQPAQEDDDEAMTEELAAAIIGSDDIDHPRRAEAMQFLLRSDDVQIYGHRPGHKGPRKRSG